MTIHSYSGINKGETFFSLLYLALDPTKVLSFSQGTLVWADGTLWTASGRPYCICIGFISQERTGKRVWWGQFHHEVAMWVHSGKDFRAASSAKDGSPPSFLFHISCLEILQPTPHSAEGPVCPASDLSHCHQKLCY